MDHVALMDRLSSRIKIDFKCGDSLSFMFKHKCAYSFKLVLTIYSCQLKQKSSPAGLFATADTCLKCSLRLLVRAWLRFILWPRCRWSICHAAIVLVRHLLTEKKTQVELSLRRSWSCRRSVWSGGSSQQTCYVNVCVLNSCVWCWEGKSSEGDRVCDFHQQKEMC